MIHLSAPQSNAGLEHALFYEGLGWSVVPAHRSVRLDDGTISCTCKRGTACDSPGKHPALVAWSQYQRRCATPEELQRWFEGEFKGYGVGIITGKVSGIFAVDVDTGPGKVGGESLDALQMMYGDLPNTIEARTGGGGRHVLLQHPGTCWIATTKNTPAPGIDIRGDGGFIVVAPSLHTSGRSYLWNEHHHPQTTPVAPAPPWLVELIKSDAPRAPGSAATPTGTGEIVRDAFGKVIDGRERYMIGIVGAAVASYLRQHQVLPNPEWVFSEAWPAYERNVRARGASLEADHRGETLMRQKVISTLRRVASGRWKVSAAPFSEAPSAAPEPAEPAEAPPEKKVERKGPSLLSISEIENLPPPTWLVEGLVPERGLAVPYGPPKKGKTFIVLSMALHIAAGLEWMGRAVEQGGVVYIAGEGVGGMGLRIKAMRSHYGIKENIPFWVATRSVNFADPTAVDGLLALIRETVLDEPISLLVVDTLARAAPGVEENSSKEMGVVIASCDRLRDELNCTVMPVHHAGKDETKGLRGSSAIHGAVDASFHVTGTGKQVTLRPVDQKEADPGPPLTFEMLEIAVGVGRSSLVPVLMTEPGEPVFEPSQRRLSTQEIIAMQALDSATSHFGKMQNVTVGIPRVITVTDAQWREAYKNLRAGEDGHTVRVAFSRVMNQLIARKIVCAHAPYVWKVKDDGVMQPAHERHTSHYE